MSEPPADDPLEARIAGLERSVAALRDEIAVAPGDAAASRVLAGGADRDVAEVRAELRAHNQVLNALRATQVEQGHLLQEHRHRLQEQGAALARLEDRVDRGFATMQAGMTQIVTLIEGIGGPERA